jgi:hypothetical protein
VGAELFLNRLHETAHARKTLVTILARLSPYTKNKRDGIISDVIDKIIISNQHEEVSSGDKHAVMSSGIIKSDSSDSEVAYNMD